MTEPKDCCFEFASSINDELNQKLEEIDGLKAEKSILLDEITAECELIKEKDAENKKLKAQLQSLSSDTQTLEEVYHRFVNYERNDVSKQLKESILKFGQEIERRARLKGLNEAAGFIEKILSLQQQLAKKDRVAYDLSVEFAEAMNALKKENQSLKDKLKAIYEKATEISDEVEKVKALEVENKRLKGESESMAAEMLYLQKITGFGPHSNLKNNQP